ncbi:MAG: hypothetical protein A2V63_12025 [Candidatus Eisenbacteria bacterium RBG_19FT_COMBO_70_11]|nr:MAG: hypothetical protein A2V63_12025 [Candidatus Eisenbacteria bacterium RBG_19FT_COMBO_70_11]
MNYSIFARLVTLLFVAPFALGATYGKASSAPNAGQVESAPGVLVQLRAEPFDNFYRVPPPTEFSLRRPSVALATITVSYLGTWDPAAQAAFQYAVDIWQTQITSAVPIAVEANWTALAPGVLGSAGPKGFWRNFTGAPQTDTWYPEALANHLSGSDLNPANAEIAANFSSSFSNWYFGTGGNPPAGKYDFVTVVMHELAHGLGFVGSMSVGGSCGTGQGCWGSGTPFPFVYDRSAENGSNQSLINTVLFPNPSTALATQLTSNDVYFDGPSARAANANSAVKLYAPAAWNQGSSYAHLDEVFNNTPNALMTFSLSSAEAVHSPGPVTRGLFEDMGWSVVTVPVLSAWGLSGLAALLFAFGVLVVMKRRKTSLATPEA